MIAAYVNNAQVALDKVKTIESQGKINLAKTLVALGKRSKDAGGYVMRAPACECIAL